MRRYSANRINDKGMFTLDVENICLSEFMVMASAGASVGLVAEWDGRRMSQWAADKALKLVAHTVEKHNGSCPLVRVFPDGDGYERKGVLKRNIGMGMSQVQMPTLRVNPLADFLVASPGEIGAVVFDALEWKFAGPLGDHYESVHVRNGGMNTPLFLPPGYRGSLSKGGKGGLSMRSKRKLPCGHHWSGDECDSPCFRGRRAARKQSRGKGREIGVDFVSPDGRVLRVRGPNARAVGRNILTAMARRERSGGPPRKHKPYHLTRKGKKALRRRMRRNGPDDRRFGLIHGEGSGDGIPRGWGKPIEPPYGYVMSDAERQMRESLFDPHMELIPPKSDRFGRIPREPHEYEPNYRRTREAKASMRDDRILTSAARMFQKKHGGSYGAAMKKVERAYFKMPGKPTAKAVAAEAGPHLSKAPLGSGERFQALVRKLMSEGKSRKQAQGLAAMIGRRKYGAKYFNSLAAAGRKRAAKRRRR